MELKEYLGTLTPNQREKYAKRCGTTAAYLIQLSGGHRLPSTDLAKRLSLESDGQVPLNKLRPDVWEAA